MRPVVAHAHLNFSGSISKASLYCLTFLAHKCSGKANLILDTLWLLVIQMLLNVLRIHDGHNGIQQQALSQKVLQRTQFITIPCSMCLHKGIHQQALNQKVLQMTESIPVQKRDSSEQVLLQPR